MSRSEAAIGISGRFFSTCQDRQHAEVALLGDAPLGADHVTPVMGDQLNPSGIGY